VFCLVLLAAIATTAFVAGVDTDSDEANLLARIQDSPLPGTFVSNLVREITTTEADIVVGVALALLLWVTGSRRHAIAFCVLLIALPLVQHELKVLVDRDRPPYNPDDLWSQPSSLSFPSGHVMSATVVYGWLAYCALSQPWPGPARWAAGIVAATALLMTSLSSVYLAVHWPTDVVGGYFWGLTLLLPTIALADSRTVPLRTGHSRK